MIKEKNNLINNYSLLNLLFKILKIADGNFKRFSKAVIFSLFNLISDLLSLGSLFPLIYLILEKESFFEKFNFLTQYDFIYNLNHIELIYLLCTIVLFLILIKVFITISFNNFFWKFTYSFEKKLQKIIFDQIINQDYDFFIRNPKGNLISLCKEETSRSAETISSLITMVVEILALIIIIFILVYTFPSTSLIILAFLTVITYLFTLYLRRKSRGLSRIRSETHNTVIRILNESFLAIKEIKFNNLKSQTNKNYNNVNEILTKTDAKGMILTVLPKVFFEFFLLLSPLLILFIFVMINLDTNLVISNLTIFSLCAYRMFPAFSRIHINYQRITFRKSSCEIVSKFLDLSQENKRETNKAIFNNLEQKLLLNLDNINFSFKNINNKSDKIFENLNLKINKGERIALIGESGSGKSTLLELILSILQPNNGKQIYNRSYFEDLEDFATKTGYLYQEQIMFNDSLANNISLKFDKNVTDYDNQSINRLKKSAENALVTDFVNSKDLFNYTLVENGSNLSAGQRQRVFIARALYKAKELLVLDEPTSNLDPDTEKTIIKNIIKNYGELSIIMSTHKYSNLEKFDYTIKIEKGKLIKDND